MLNCPIIGIAKKLQVTNFAFKQLKHVLHLLCI